MQEMQDNRFLRLMMLSGFCITGVSCDASEKCIRSYFLDRGEMVTKFYEIIYALLYSSEVRNPPSTNPSQGASIDMRLRIIRTHCRLFR